MKRILFLATLVVCLLVSAASATAQEQRPDGELAEPTPPLYLPIIQQHSFEYLYLRLNEYQEDYYQSDHLSAAPHIYMAFAEVTLPTGEVIILNRGQFDIRLAGCGWGCYQPCMGCPEGYIFFLWRFAEGGSGCYSLDLDPNQDVWMAYTTDYPEVDPPGICQNP
jgi:hypothetical protein